MELDRITTNAISWLNPFSSEYKNAFNEISQLEQSQIILVIAITAITTIAFTYTGGVCGIGGYAVFRYSVTMLKKSIPQRNL